MNARTRDPMPAVDERTVSTTDEFWFGAYGSPRDTDSPPDDMHSGAWAHEVDAEALQDRQDRIANRPGGELGRRAPTAFERIYRAFIAARAALGVALVVTLSVAGLFSLRPPGSVAALSVAYAVLAICLWILPRFRKQAAPTPLIRLHTPQWVATIGADLVCFTGLHVLSPGSSFNYVALLVLPVLMAGVLTPRLIALATAATATLALLGSAWLSVLAGGEGTLLFTQAGLAGSGFFVITLLAGELAGRIAREQLSARGSLEMARQQAQLNRLVIEEMQDGVLVVDRGGKVRAANPAARRLLSPEGMAKSAPFQLRGVPAWGDLVRTVERAFSDASWPEAGRDVLLQFEPDLHRTLRARIRFTRKREPLANEAFCVLFLEDLRNVQARTRQEKLAAMGRVSAGIAHEIRNPLAAIAQANALLSEDATDPVQRQLMKMVTDNVERLKRIVDDVMEAAPGQVQEAGMIDVGVHVAAVCSEWAQASGLVPGPACVLQLELPDEPLGGVFDGEHLRRVLVNLLDNAYRHASREPGAVRLALAPNPDDDERVSFSVRSDGDPIAADVEPYLFEPFFSTRSRGTGLGLYICRELCERYGARIDYRLLPPDQLLRNEFSVDMRRAASPAADSRFHLTP